VGLDDQANTVIGWTVQAADLVVWVRGFGTDGTDAGRLSAQQLSQALAGRQEQMTVAVSPWAEVAVAYTDDNDNNTFDQVILGLDISNNNW
jgi:outer membrane biogenesis lipoprotein LolB